MNPEKFTQKTIEVLNLSGELAAERGNPTVEPIHVLFALLKAVCACKNIFGVIYESRETHNFVPSNVWLLVRLNEHFFFSPH